MVTLTEVNLSPFNLVDTIYIHLRTKLANNNIRIVDLTTYYLAVAVYACHNIIDRVHISA